MKIAFVYDWLDSWGGAERVLLTFHKMFPRAPIFTSIYQPKKAIWAKNFEIKTSFLQKFPFAKTKRKFYTALMPLAFETFNFSQYQLVISVSSFAAKGIITLPKTKHIDYLLTPTRFLWQKRNQYLNAWQEEISQPILNYLKNWDQMAAQRPDQIISISKTVQKRCQKYYHRSSQIIYPPVKKYFQPGENKSKKYFLLVSRLEPYKKVDIAIRTFNQLNWPLKIIGQGTQEKKLKKMAHANIKFLKDLTDFQLLRYYQNSRAIIFPQEEDFGLVAVEAQACGKPVIAFRAGGAQEIIINRKTGLLFTPQDSGALRQTLLKFKSSHYNKKDCIQNAQKFNEKHFIEQWYTIIKQYESKQ